MSWRALIKIVAAECGWEAAERIERRAQKELPGVRFTVPALDRPAAKPSTRVAEAQARALREHLENRDPCILPGTWRMVR
jgi:hypothetical protein